MKDITNGYPSLNKIRLVYKKELSLLNHTIYWQEKRDGSNIGAYVLPKYPSHLLIRSRNKMIASEDFQYIFHSLPESCNVAKLLYTHSDYIIFGELLIKGRSPTKTEYHIKNKFVIFDIWTPQGFLPPLSMYFTCYYYHLPTVKLYGTSRHKTIESLYDTRNQMLKIAKKNNREGVVGKTNYGPVFTEKLDIVKSRHPKSQKDSLLPLPESEILGALDKVKVDIGLEQIKDVSVAMPLFAKYVAIECKKHKCRKPKNIFKYYEEEQFKILAE